jgi:hypothetical protein
MEWLPGVLPIALIALVCPLMMWLMMRGMHGEHGSDVHSHTEDDVASRQKLAELQREVAELRKELVAPAHAAPAGAANAGLQSSTGNEPDGVTPREATAAQQSGKE